MGTTGTPRSAYQWQAQSGYRNDGDIGGLIKVGCRYYDPQTGRFTSRDSDLSQPAYVYCDGDPVNGTDPTGHSDLGNYTGFLFAVLTVIAILAFNPVGGAVFLGSPTGILLVAGAIALGVSAGDHLGDAINEANKERDDRDPPGHEPEPKGGGNINQSQPVQMYQDWDPVTYEWIGDPYPGPPHGPIQNNPHPPK